MNPPSKKESGITAPEPNPSPEAPPSAVEEMRNSEAEVPPAVEEGSQVLEAAAGREQVVEFVEAQEDQGVAAEDEEAEDQEVFAEDEEADNGENLIGSEQDVDEEGIEKSEAEEVEGDGDDVADDDDAHAEIDGGKSASDDDLYNEEDEDDDPLMKRNNKKELDIYIGRLHKEAVENDLVKIFGTVGEIESVKIAKHPLTQKSKGFAFIRYTTSEHAKKALSEFKNGTKVKGKWVKVSAGQDKDTLYLGNICKTWTRNHVIETLKSYGVEHIEQILLPNDPKNEGKIKGFAYLEFSSHNDAMAAFRRLRHPDAIFGCDRSAKVSFTHTPMHPSEEVMSQVKTVYVEGLPLSWDEEKVEEICQQYGVIEKVQIPRNSTKQKRKDFGFIAFTSRASAVSCVEGINNAQLGKGVKVKASLAKPLNKGWLVKQAARGGFNITRDSEDTEKISKTNARSKGFHALAHPRTSQSAKGKKRGGKFMKAAIDERPSKKGCSNHNFGNTRPSTGSGNPQNAHFGNQKFSYEKRPLTSRNATHEATYQDHAYAGASRYEHHNSEMESHAGLLPAAQQGQNPYGHDYIRSGAYSSQPRSASGYAAVYLLPISYPEDYSSYVAYQAGYTYPSSGAYTLDGAYYY